MFSRTIALVNQLSATIDAYQKAIKLLQLYDEEANLSLYTKALKELENK
jgi:hypothetical protein